MFQKLAKTILIAALGFQLSGCVLLVGAAVGASGVVWAKGRLEQVINKPMDKVHAAVISGLKKMDLPLIIDRKDQLTSKVESKFSDGTNVWIDIEQLTNTSTRITIRVGVMGDQARSNAILESIKSYL